jgi:hypothetical protein
MEKWTIGAEVNVALTIVYFPIRGNLLRGHLPHPRTYGHPYDAESSSFPNFLALRCCANARETAILAIAGAACS